MLRLRNGITDPLFLNGLERTLPEVSSECGLNCNAISLLLSLFLAGIVEHLCFPLHKVVKYE